MSYYKFKKGDILNNRIKVKPQIDFKIYDNKLYYNNNPQESGSFTDSVGCSSPGHISLYEINVDRNTTETGLVYPFIEKNSSLTAFRTTTVGTFNNDFDYGDQITGSYPLSASISSVRYASGHNNIRIKALKNTLNNYKILNPEIAFSSSFGDKSQQELRLISIPSIFYGSSIDKGTVSLKFYVTGNLISELRDDKQNGLLRQVASGSGADSGSVGGVVLYNEGFMLLTGSWSLSTHTEDYTGGGSASPRWVDFATLTSSIPSSSFDLSFSGSNYVSTMTMFARAERGDINFSNNPTSLNYNPIVNNSIISGSTVFAQAKDRQVKNMVSASYSSPEPPYEKTIFIENVGIYDENKNLIAVAKMAKPIRKRNSDDLTFKLKLDF
jgi:hypothetical protein